MFDATEGQVPQAAARPDERKAKGGSDVTFGDFGIQAWSRRG